MVTLKTDSILHSSKTRKTEKPLPVPYAYTPAPPPIPLSYTVKGAMAATGLGRSVIFQLMADQNLERVKIGKRTVIPHASLMALISGKAS